MITDKQLEQLQECTYIVEEIKELDLKILKLKVQAELLAEDLEGTRTNCSLGFTFKNMDTIQEQLRGVDDKDKAVFEDSNHPILKMFSSINPQKEEYKIHLENTEEIELKLDPSEALIALHAIQQVYFNRKKVLIQVIEQMVK
jgi:hypothetical protein